MRVCDHVFGYGGDEVAFLLPATDAEGTAALAERARAAVCAIGPGVSASIGMSTYPVDGATAAEVLLAADRACYVAKAGGRDRVASAEEGRTLTAFSLQAPTPVDSPSVDPELGV